MMEIENPISRELKIKKDSNPQKMEDSRNKDLEKFIPKESFFLNSKPFLVSFIWSDLPHLYFFLSTSTLYKDIPSFDLTPSTAPYAPFDLRENFVSKSLPMVIRSPGGLSIVSNQLQNYNISGDEQDKTIIGPYVDHICTTSVKISASPKMEALVNFAGFGKNYEDAMTVLIPSGLDVKKLTCPENYRLLMDTLSFHMSNTFVFPHVQDVDIKSLSDEKIHVQMSEKQSTFNGIDIIDSLSNTVEKISYHIAKPLVPVMGKTCKMCYSVESLYQVNEYLNNIFKKYLKGQLAENIEKMSLAIETLRDVSNRLERKSNPNSVSQFLGFNLEISTLFKKINSKK